MSELRAGYKQTEVGVLPEEWDAVPMSAITSDIGDGLHGTPVYASNGDYFFINGNNLKDGKIVVTGDTKTVDYTEFFKNKKNLNGRTILMSINGTIGNLGLFDGEAVVLGKSAAYLNVKQGVSRQFVYHLLQTEPVRRQFFDGLTGSTIGNLGLATIRNAKAPLPPTKAEQEVIAEALSDADALIESLEQLLAKKRQIKQAAMQELLTGKKRLPGFSRAWEVKRLGSVLKFQVGFPFGSSFFNEENQGVRLVKNRDLKGDDQIFHYSGKYDQEFLVRDGDVLIGMDGDFLPCLWTKGPALLNQRVGRIVPFEALDRTFAYYFLLEPLREIENVTACTTVKHLSHGDIEGIEKPLPVIHEQIAIATALSDIDAELTYLETQLTKTRAVKQGMMQKLLTGEIRLI